METVAPVVRSMTPSLFCTGLRAFFMRSSSASVYPIAYATQRLSFENAGSDADATIFGAPPATGWMRNSPVPLLRGTGGASHLPSGERTGVESVSHLPKSAGVTAGLG